MAELPNPKFRHFTTRPGFAIFVGLWVLSLYLMWAAYGAAPTNLRFLAETQDKSMGGMAQGGHGARAGGLTPEQFRKITLKFIEDLSLPDGSVRPTRQWMDAMAAMGDGHQEREAKAGEHRAMDEAKGDGAATAGAAGHGGMAREEEEHGADEAGKPIDVYLMAVQFSYTPTVLRLKRGVAYRFRMMSMDVNHGVSIHTGFAGHIMRRPAQTMTEMVMTFDAPGEFMMYCTVYCGEGHSKMKGKIIVE